MLPGSGTAVPYTAKAKELGYWETPPFARSSARVWEAQHVLALDHKVVFGAFPCIAYRLIQFVPPGTWTGDDCQLRLSSCSHMAVSVGRHGPISNMALPGTVNPVPNLKSNAVWDSKACTDVGVGG